MPRGGAQTWRDQTWRAHCARKAIRHGNMDPLIGLWYAIATPEEIKARALELDQRHRSQGILAGKKAA